MENQHRKIAGYRDLSQTEIDLMNEAKALERKFNSLIDKLRSTAGLDQRNVALAQTHGEDAFMRAVRAVAQPERQTEETAKFERMDAEIAPAFDHQGPGPSEVELAPNTYRKAGYVHAVEAREIEVFETGSGQQTAQVGDFIITNPDGDRYPCPRQTFLSTYVPT